MTQAAPPPRDRPAHAPLPGARTAAAAASAPAFDVVIVGGGSAGWCCAGHLARAGRSVAVVDARPAARSGARWVDGVPRWMFEAAGVAPPQPPELRWSGEPFTMLTRADGARVTVPDCPAWSVDMGLLVDRLRSQALAAGAVAFDEHALRDVALDGEGRPRVAMVEPRRGAGPAGGLALSARLFVDASGTAGVLRRRVPAAARACPPPAPRDVCSAAQEVAAIADVAAARRDLARWGLRSREIRSRIGVSGGYSIANLCVDLDAGEVDLLTGAIAIAPYRSGPALIAELRAAHPWIGARHFGGAGAIPLRRPYDRLAFPGLALLGNAACQVFSPHGSGVGTGLIAASMLAQAVASADDPGAAAATWAYARRFHAELGGLLAAVDLVRRASQALDADAIEGLLAAGLIHTASARATLAQQLPRPGLRDALGLWSGLRDAEARRALPRLASALAPVPRIVLHARRYPAAPDLQALRRWGERLARLTATATDPPGYP